MDGPLVAISDWPDFAMRAVLLDLNPYGRVPKMDTLLGIIDVLSLLKINQFHTFFRVGSTDASYLCYCKRWDYIYLLIFLSKIKTKSFDRENRDNIIFKAYLFGMYRENSEKFWAQFDW